MAGIHDLSDDEIDAQIATLQANAREAAPQSKVVPYRIDGFAL
jgi:hypothetical protein